MDNNPLRQYFRRPAVYLRLPSGGKGYSSEVLDITETNEIPVYPMTAIDEITTRTPDALFNGSAITDLIKSCVPAIKNPWEIQSIDLDAILISIRAASGSDALDVDTVCPACGEESRFGINLAGVLSSLKPGDFDTVYETNDLKIKFRPLRYKEMNKAAQGQFEVQQMFISLDGLDEKKREEVSFSALEKITQLTISILSQTIEYIDTPNIRVEENEFIVDFLKNCDRQTYAAIKDYNAELRSSTEVKPLQITCPSCNHKYEQAFTLNPADFFD